MSDQPERTQHEIFISNLDRMQNWCLEQTDEHFTYSDENLADAAGLLLHVAGNMAFDFLQRNDKTFSEMCDEHEAFGAAIRSLLIKHTGIDLHEVYDRNALDAQEVG